MREFEDGGESDDGELVLDGKISGVTRREFLEIGVAATLAVCAGKKAWAADAKAEVPRRTLGRTAEKGSMVGLGGDQIGHPNEVKKSILIRPTSLHNGTRF